MQLHLWAFPPNFSHIFLQQNSACFCPSYWTWACAAETIDTESIAAEAIQHEKKSNRSVQSIAQSDEDDTEDEHDSSSGDAPGDMINKGNDCSEETETSWLVLQIWGFFSYNLLATYHLCGVLCFHVCIQNVNLMSSVYFISLAILIWRVIFLDQSEEVSPRDFFHRVRIELEIFLWNSIYDYK